jgi:ribosomal-protein-alanine N-acetyltransferase
MTRTARVRPLAPADSAPLATLYRANRDYLAPFEPLREEAFLPADGQATRINDLLTEEAQGQNAAKTGAIAPVFAVRYRFPGPGE